ncbi:MAG: AAA family ATPase [Tyzzerella sp.]|nr:AAA family ATPase [Tyzzerella sp.]
MGNYIDTKEEVKNHLFARVPLIIINSSERERVERMFRELAAEMKTSIYYYTDVKQVVSLYGNAKKDVDRDPMMFVQDLFRKNRSSTFVIGDARRLSEENAFSREVLDTLYLAMETSSTLVLVTPDYVWNRLAQFGLQVVLQYPDLIERESLIRKFVGCYGGKYPIQWNEHDIYRAAMLLSGFSEVQIDNILVSQLVAHKGLKKQNLLDLTRQKSRLYATVPCVEEVQVKPNLMVSGLDNLRKWIRERKQLFFIEDDVLDEYGLTAPKGILLAGIPGCGKSYSSKMIAAEWELPLFRFDIGAIYDKWMGESERKMKDALTFIDNMAPCVVWIDEIEKALSVSDSGNDTGKRILGQFLYWLQESSKRVFLVATANDITALPPELFRKGRFSEIFFIDLPNSEERKVTIEQYAAKCLHMQFSDEAMEELVRASEGFSYSDIESVIKEAAQFCILNTDVQMDLNKLIYFFNQNISFSSTNPETVQKLRKWGRERAVSASIENKQEGSVLL